MYWVPRRVRFAGEIEPRTVQVVLLLSFFSYRFEFMWKTSFSFVVIKYVVWVTCKSTKHLTKHTNTALFHLTKQDTLCCLDSYTIKLRTFKEQCRFYERIVWVMVLVLLFTFFITLFHWIVLCAAFDMRVRLNSL